MLRFVGLFTAAAVAAVASSVPVFAADHSLADTTRSVAKSDGDPETLYWCEFGSDTQLVCKFGGETRVDSDIAGFSRVVSVPLAGGKVQELGQAANYYLPVGRQYDGDILDWLPESPGSVLIGSSPELSCLARRVCESYESHLTSVDGQRICREIDMGGGLSFMLMLALASTPAANNSKNAPADDGDKVVCRLITEAGSRIPFRVCRTKADWDRMAKENQDDWTNSRNSRVNACNSVNCQ